MLVDVRDDEADLVGVGGHPDERAALRPYPEPDVAERIAAGLAERRQAAADDVLHRRLEPRRAGRQAQVTQQIDVRSHRSLPDPPTPAH